MPLSAWLAIRQPNLGPSLSSFLQSPDGMDFSDEQAEAMLVLGRSFSFQRRGTLRRLLDPSLIDSMRAVLGNSFDDDDSNPAVDLRIWKMTLHDRAQRLKLGALYSRARNWSAIPRGQGPNRSARERSSGAGERRGVPRRGRSLESSKGSTMHLGVAQDPCCDARGDHEGRSAGASRKSPAAQIAVGTEGVDDDRPHVEDPAPHDRKQTDEQGGENAERIGKHGLSQSEAAQLRASNGGVEGPSREQSNEGIAGDDMDMVHAPETGGHEALAMDGSDGVAEAVSGDHASSSSDGDEGLLDASALFCVKRRRNRANAPTSSAKWLLPCPRGLKPPAAEATDVQSNTFPSQSRTSLPPLGKRSSSEVHLKPAPRGKCNGILKDFRSWVDTWNSDFEADSLLSDLAADDLAPERRLKTPPRFPLRQHPSSGWLHDVFCDPTMTSNSGGLPKIGARSPPRQFVGDATGALLGAAKRGHDRRRPAYDALSFSLGFT